MNGQLIPIAATVPLMIFYEGIYIVETRTIGAECTCHSVRNSEVDV